MTVQEKANNIQYIIEHMRIAAKRKGVAFDAGTLWITLAFRTDKELQEILRAI